MAQKATKTTKTTKTTVSTQKKTTTTKWVGDQDLYIELNGKKVTSAEQFKSQISPIYNVEEFYWTGKIEPQARIRFIRSNNVELPLKNEYNHGFSLVGQAASKFEVRNALPVPSETNDCVNIYVNPESELYYIGDSNKHNVYVRVYDNSVGNHNDRWLTISIE